VRLIGSEGSGQVEIGEAGNSSPAVYTRLLRFLLLENRIQDGTWLLLSALSCSSPLSTPPASKLTSINPSQHHVDKPTLPSQLPGRLPRPVNLQSLLIINRNILSICNPNLSIRSRHRIQSRRLRLLNPTNPHITNKPVISTGSISHPLFNLNTPLPPLPLRIPSHRIPTSNSLLVHPHPHPWRPPAPRKWLVLGLRRVPGCPRTREVVYRRPHASRRGTILSSRDGDQGRREIRW